MPLISPPAKGAAAIDNERRRRYGKQLRRGGLTPPPTRHVSAVSVIGTDAQRITLI
jgi:hypothetical protein